MPITPIPFYMIRHGETTANAEGFYSGNMDVPLTDKGRKQAEEARAIVNLLDNKPKTIVHSHLSRARNTAQIINYDMQLVMHETSLLGEHNFGDWQGQSWENVQSVVKNTTDPPNGETQDEFRQRVKKGINYSLTLESPVLTVCHGGIFRAFRKLYGQEDMPTVQNCKLYHFEPDTDQSDFPWKVNLIE